MIFIVIFKYTLHATQKMDALGINKSEVENVTIKGSKWKEDAVIHSKMGGIEVVFKRVENAIIVITVYYSD